STDTVGDVITRSNESVIGNIMSSIGADGVSLTLTGDAGDDITVNEVGGGTVAGNLGIVTPTASGPGLPVLGTKVHPILTSLTPLADVKAGVGIDLSSGLIITNGLKSATLDFNGAK